MEMTNPPFGFDVPEHSPGFLLWQTTITWQRLIKKALEPHKISHAQFVIMAILLWWQGKETDVTQIVVVQMSKLDKMTVSQSLKKLVRLDLVSRHENKDDARAKTIFLTIAGAKLAKKLVPIIEGIDTKFFGRLNSAEQDALIKAFQKL